MDTQHRTTLRATFLSSAPHDGKNTNLTPITQSEQQKMAPSDKHK